MHFFDLFRYTKQFVNTIVNVKSPNVNSLLFLANPFGEVAFGKMPFGELIFGESSGHQKIMSVSALHTNTHNLSLS